jgi:uncharacterized membrane protein YfcA
MLVSAVMMAWVERLPRFRGFLVDRLDIALSIVAFTVSGAILGAQPGAGIACHIPQRVLQPGMGVLFIAMP